MERKLYFRFFKTRLRRILGLSNLHHLSLMVLKVIKVTILTIIVITLHRTTTAAEDVVRAEIQPLALASEGEELTVLIINLDDEFIKYFDN